MIKSTKIKLVITLLVILLIIFSQHLQMTYSASISLKYCLKMNAGLQLLNMMIAAIPFLLCCCITGNITVSLGLSILITTVFSIINYHVFLYHGTPFLASDLYNIGTAINVLSSYSIIFDNMVIRLLMIAAAEIVLLVLDAKLFHKDGSYSLRKPSVITLVLNVTVLWVLFLSKWTIFPNNLVSWSWAKPMQKNGYEVCFANSIHTALNKFSTMEGYDPELLEKYIDDQCETGKYDIGNDEYPDIILILNETLCDLNYCADIPEGQEALEIINRIPGIISGYSTVPLIGGGTNRSEYELLTSNSFYQISVASPFSTLDMTKTDSIVGYLNSLGYSGTAMHCYSDTNYSRNDAYPALGFKNVYLGKEYYTYNTNGNREWLDKDNYNDLLTWYRQADDNPQLMYLLTFQNHGGYEQNESELDTVNIGKDLGQYTDDVNEFLSSLTLSSEAFADLISELSDSDRPVIVLMVGDHAPSFIGDIPYSTNGNKVDPSVTQRTVPYYVWSNTELNQEVFTQSSTLTDLVPMLLKAADMPLSRYYQMINDLHVNVPIRTSDGIYIDKDGNKLQYSSDQPYYEQIRDYYYMEYNTLQHGEDYMSQLFACE